MSLKVADIRSLSEAELREKLNAEQQELFGLRFKHATSQLEQTHKITEARGNIARIKTIMRERFGVKV